MNFREVNPHLQDTLLLAVFLIFIKKLKGIFFFLVRFMPAMSKKGRNR